ncbi:MAG: Ig-like domain-containing protein [Candidatus Njordarchaeota archaeon]
MKKLIIIILIFSCISYTAETKINTLHTDIKNLPVSSTYRTTSDIIHKNRMNQIQRYQMQRFDIKEETPTIIKYTEKTALYPGEICEVERIKIGTHIDIAIRGKNYITINGSQKIVTFTEEILDWDIGDIENDGHEEIAVLTQNYIYIINDDLTVRWKTNRRDNINRIYIGGGPNTQQCNLIVGWINNNNTIAYYNHTGEYIDTIKLGGNPNITEIIHTENYYYAFVPPHYIFYWKYGSTIGNNLHAAPSSHLTKDEDGTGIYEIHNDTISTEIWHIEGVSQDTYWAIDDLNDYAFFVSGPKIAVYDVDGDSEYEFVLWNDTKMVLIDRTGASSASYKETILHNIKDLAMIPSYIVILRNSQIEFYYYSDLSYVGSISPINIKNLTDPYLFLYAYGQYGECYEIFDPTKVNIRFLHAGYRFSFWEDHFIAYNSHRLIEYYPNTTREYIFDGFIETAMVTSSGFAINWFNGTGCLYRNGYQLWKYPWNIDAGMYADYNIEEDELYIANSTGHIFQIKKNIFFAVWTPPLSGNMKPVRIFAYPQGYLYAIVNYTDTNATINIYNNSIEEINKTIFIEVPNTCLEAYFASGDIDNDKRNEYALTLFLQGKDLGYYAIVGSFYIGVYDDNWTLKYNESESLYYPIQYEPTYATFYFNDSFLIIKNADIFLRIRGTDWGIETYNLTGYEKWASDGIMISNKEIKVINSQGSAVLAFENAIKCISRRDKWTKAILLSNNYTVWNITVSEDNSPPLVDITFPSENQTINSSDVEITWTMSDDLKIKRAEIMIDNTEWIEIEGNSYIANNLSEGNHVVYINVTDIANRTTTASRSFIVDIPIEIVSWCAENNTWINRSWIIINWETHGPVTNISIYANDTRVFSDNTLNGSHNLSLSDGYWNIKIVAYGHNEEVSNVVYIGIDTTPPTIRVTNPKNNSEVSLTDAIIVTVEISCWDNIGVSYVEYSINGSTWHNVGTPHNVTIVFASEGYYIIRFRVFDQVGNNNATTLRLILDADPVFNVYYPENDSWIKENNITFMWNSTHIDYVELYINDRLNKTLPNSGICILMLDEGIWNITLIAKGFRDKVISTLIIKIDQTPPTITVVEPENNTKIETQEKYVSIFLKLSINDNIGYKYILIRLNNYTVNTTSLTVELILSQGTHRIKIETYDYAENIAKVTLIISIEPEANTATNTILYAFVVAGSLLIGIVLERKGYITRITRKIRRS